MAGSTTYPESVDNKTELQDGIDVIQADDVNDAYSPIDAIETFVGANGKGASWSTDLLDHLANLKPPKCIKKDANTITVQAGAILIKSANQANRLFRRNTSDVDVTAADLDTGAFANATMYFVYAVADAAATTFTVVISASDSAPDGCTNYELIGWFWNEQASALNITSGFVGNVKRPGIENELTVFDADSVNTTSASYVDVEPTIHFWSGSKKILIVTDCRYWMGDANGAYMHMTLKIDGSDDATCDRAFVRYSAGQSEAVSAKAGLIWAGTTADNAMYFLMRLLSYSPGYSPTVADKYYYVKEL